MSHRKINEKVLKLEWDSRGYQSMGILHHLGLVNKHKGLLNGMLICDALHALESTEKEDFDEIISIINT